MKSDYLTLRLLYFVLGVCLQNNNFAMIRRHNFASRNKVWNLNAIRTMKWVNYQFALSRSESMVHTRNWKSVIKCSTFSDDRSGSKSRTVIEGLYSDIHHDDSNTCINVLRLMYYKLFVSHFPARYSFIKAYTRIFTMMTVIPV